MAPTTAPVDLVVHSFQIQQALQLIPRQYQPPPPPPENDPLGTQPGVRASLAVPVMLVLLIFCVGLA